MADAPFLGLRGTEDFTVTGQRPKDWKGTYRMLYPNGKAPLTALLSMTSSSPTTDPEFNWFQKDFPTQSLSITGVWTTEAGSTAYGGTGDAGDLVYVTTGKNGAANLTTNHTLLLRGLDDSTKDVVALVTVIKREATKDTITLKLLQATTTMTTANIKTALIIGTAYAEGAVMGESVTYDPYVLKNYTQIFRNPLEITRTAMKTKLRTEDEYKRLKAETLEIHSVEMEKAFLFGVPSIGVGSNGKPLRTTGGIIHSIRTNGGHTSTFDKTLKWLDEGQAWLDELLMKVFRYGSEDKLAFVGDAALLAINQLIRKNGQWNYTPQTTSFGMNVYILVTPFGQLTLKTHPLFSHEASNQNSMLIFEPKELTYRYVTDTEFKGDSLKDGGSNSKDGLNEEYLTEAGLEFNYPKSWAVFDGIGKGA